MHLSRHLAPFAAVLLAVAPHYASAATLSVDLPGCAQVQLSGTGPNYTLSCAQSSMTCVAQANPVSPNGGTATSLTVACAPAATSVTWSASRDCTNPNGGQTVGQASVTEVIGGRSCVYTAAATAPGMTGSASVAVVWQGQSTAAAPTGCAITRTPSSGSLGTGGGAVTMNATCSGGGAVTSWSWRKGTTTGWRATQAAQDTLPANTGSAAVTHTYGVTACSNGACAQEVVTTFTVAGSAPVGFCSQFSDVRFVDLTWGGYVDTAGSAGVGVAADTILVGRITVPANFTPKSLPGVVSVVEHGAGQSERIITMSTQPCDFRGYSPGYIPPKDPTGNTGPMAWGVGINPQIFFQAATTAQPPVLNAGQTYFVNMRNWHYMTGQNNCTTSTCDVRVTVNPPN